MGPLEPLSRYELLLMGESNAPGQTNIGTGRSAHAAEQPPSYQSVVGTGGDAEDKENEKPRAGKRYVRHLRDELLVRKLLRF